MGICADCMYRMPVYGEGYCTCLNADSGRMFRKLKEGDGCTEWYSDKILEEVEDEEIDL